MPHQRTRLITPTLLKRLRLWPVLGLIGPRQCGKSTLLREILSQSLATSYSTMDSKNARERAARSPESFAEPEKGKIKIIDEVQKVPDLFDAVKFHIDRKRRPGTYILSGSTEFSQFLGIRESLTGRIGILHLYPFNLSEVHSKTFGRYFLKPGNYRSQIPLTELDRRIERGGMPGFFYLHSQAEYGAAAQLWIETTCFRDLGKVLTKNFDPELALAVLTEIAQAEVPSATVVALKLRKDTRVINRYLEGFIQILVLKKLAPHIAGVGKPHYVLIDPGLATYLGASRESALRSHLLIEALSTFEAAGLPRPQVEYYRSEKKSYVPLIFTWRHEKRSLIVQIVDAESPRRGELASIQSLAGRIDIGYRGIVLSQASESYREAGLEFHPIRG